MRGKSLAILTTTIVVFLIVFSCMFESVHALETIDVPSYREIDRNIYLTSGDRVNGTLNATGLEIMDFAVTDFNDSLILHYVDTLGTIFSFTAANTGTYTMHFRNSYSLPAQYTIDYSITKPEGSIDPSIEGSGLPINAISIIMAVIAVGLALILGLIALKRRKEPSPPEADQSSSLTRNATLELPGLIDVSVHNQHRHKLDRSVHRQMQT